MYFLFLILEFASFQVALGVNRSYTWRRSSTNIAPNAISGLNCSFSRYIYFLKNYASLSHSLFSLMFFYHCFIVCFNRQVTSARPFSSTAGTILCILMLISFYYLRIKISLSIGRSTQGLLQFLLFKVQPGARSSHLCRVRAAIPSIIKNKFVGTMSSIIVSFVMYPVNTVCPLFMHDLHGELNPVFFCIVSCYY
jgi:hypothetical protein